MKKEYRNKIRSKQLIRNAVIELLKANVRSFLNMTGTVNKGIRETIRTEPERFFAYNNGIATTARSVKFEKTSSGLVMTEFDGLQIINGGQTTAKLNPNWFASGYFARGWDSKKNYYKADLIYSFNKKEYLPREFPKRTLTLSSTYDIMAPSDKFMKTDKDNVFTSFKWSKVDKMMFYNRQEITFEREEDWGFKTTVGFKTEENEGASDLYFIPMRQYS